MMKIKQKLSLDSFAKLNAQLKEGGVHVVAGVKDVVTTDHVIGKVSQIFRIGDKMEVASNLSGHHAKDSYRFTQINGVYYLAKSE